MSSSSSSSSSSSNSSGGEVTLSYGGAFHSRESELSQARQLIARLQNELEGIRSTYDNDVLQSARFQQQLSRLSADLAASEGAAADWKKKYDDKTKALNEKESLVTRLKADVEERERAAKIREEKLGELSLKFRGLLKDSEEKTEELGNVRVELDGIYDRLSLAEDQHAVAIEECKKAKGELKIVLQAKVNKEQQCYVLLKEKEKLTNALASLRLAYQKTKGLAAKAAIISANAYASSVSRREGVDGDEPQEAEWDTVLRQARKKEEKKEEDTWVDDSLQRIEKRQKERFATMMKIEREYAENEKKQNRKRAHQHQQTQHSQPPTAQRRSASESPTRPSTSFSSSFSSSGAAVPPPPPPPPRDRSASLEVARARKAVWLSRERCNELEKYIRTLKKANGALSARFHNAVEEREKYRRRLIAMEQERGRRGRMQTESEKENFNETALHYSPNWRTSRRDGDDDFANEPVEIKDFVNDRAFFHEMHAKTWGTPKKQLKTAFGRTMKDDEQYERKSEGKRTAWMR